MADIKNQLVKDTYNYVLQSDLSTGVVYRIGGDIPIDPKFLAGLTVSGSVFTYNLSAQTGYILTSVDSNGVGQWQPFSSVTNNIIINSAETYNITYVLGKDDAGDTFWQPYSSTTEPYITGGTYNPNTGYLYLDDQFGNSVEITGFTENELKYFVQDDTPVAVLKSGDRWYETDTEIERVWIDDGITQQWVDLFPNVLNGGAY
jgi:hypothetical protein